MRVDAKVGFFNAVVLIDSGSTHNFISTRMVDRLRLPVVPTETFTVRVANGAWLQCQGKFEKVQVLLQEIPFFPDPLFTSPNRFRHCSGCPMVGNVKVCDM